MAICLTDGSHGHVADLKQNSHSKREERKSNMNISKFKEIIATLEATHINDYFRIKELWEQEIEVLCEDIESTSDYIRNDCTDSELSWISEVWDKVAYKTQSKTFIDACQYAIAKYPLEDKKYHLTELFNSFVLPMMDD